MESEVTITKVKVKDSLGYVSYIMNKENGSKDKITNECGDIVHPDLIASLDRLKPHLVIICQMKEFIQTGAKNKLLSPEQYDFEDLNDIEVTGVTISGNGEKKGCCIIGGRNLTNGKYLPLTSPFTMFASDSDDYKYGVQLLEDIETCEREAKEYLNGKKAVEQQRLEFTEEPEGGVDDGSQKEEF